MTNNEAIDTKEKMWKAIHNKRKQMKDNTKTRSERVYCDTAIREFKKIEDFLESPRTSSPEECLLGEDLPYGDDLGCRIYGYVDNGEVKITRVEYTKHLGEGKDGKCKESLRYYKSNNSHNPTTSGPDSGQP